MRIATALLSCLLIAAVGGMMPGAAHKPSGDFTPPDGSGPGRTTLPDCAAPPDAFEYQSFLEVALGLSPRQGPEIKGSLAQPGDKKTGSIVEEGPDYLYLNTKCEKGVRFFLAYCVKKKENYITFRRPFDKIDLKTKDCCDGNLFRVIQK